MRHAECIIFPDIHGREFWKAAFRPDCEWETDTYIFLGDFFDPYGGLEGISEETAIANFMELQDDISKLRSSHKKVVSLIGNHDAHYINKVFDTLAGGVRKSKDYADYIGSLLNEDKTFKHSIAYEMTIGDKRVLFTHAGVTSDWYNLHKEEIGELSAEGLNKLTYSDKGWMALSEISEFRGGLNNYGSCIYADLHEHFEDYNLKGTPMSYPVYNYQVFGHTQQLKAPVINDKFAMLDCRKAFAMDTHLKFYSMIFS